MQKAAVEAEAATVTEDPVAGRGRIGWRFGLKRPSSSTLASTNHGSERYAPLPVSLLHQIRTLITDHAGRLKRPRWDDCIQRPQ